MRVKMVHKMGCKLGFYGILIGELLWVLQALGDGVET